MPSQKRIQKTPPSFDVEQNTPSSYDENTYTYTVFSPSPTTTITLNHHQYRDTGIDINKMSSENDQSLQDEKPQKHQSDSDGSTFTSGDNDEYITVQLTHISKEVQCPICLEIIRKTRTVMECLHRLCRECIHKSMRQGKKECPICRTHCASGRSLRDDPNFDALISALYPDIDKYEEEFVFNEEEKARNNKIQDSIAQILHRQSEARGKKRSSGRA